MNESLATAFAWRKSPYFEIAMSVLMAIFMSAALVNLSLFNFFILMLLLISPYLFINPYKTFLFFLSLIILFPNVDYAVKEGSNIIDIYWRGSGILPFSLINCLLFFIFGAALFGLIREKRNRFDRFLLLDFSVLVFLVISLIYIMVSFLTNPRGISMEGFRNAVSQFGVMGIVEFCLVYFVVKIIVSKKKQIIELTNLIFFLILAKASYGIIRFAFFGGEPRDYATQSGVNLKLTFFDIFDSAFFMYILAFCFLNIFILSKKKLIFFITIFITLFNILFSYRREAWIGSIFALIYLFQRISKGKRILFQVVVLIVLIPTLLFLITMRFGSMEGYFGDISFDFTSSNKMGRFGELFYAIKTICESPIFGLGASGEYITSPSFEWPAPPSMVHSAIVHIALKMGLVGLFILFFVIIGIYLLNSRHRKISFQDDKLKVIMYSAYSILIFSIPDILFGTPLVQFRHAAALGFFVGLVRVCAKSFILENKVTSCR
jgi:O-antigen ligase